MAQVWQNILAPVGVWIHQRLTSASEKTIEQYYEDLDRPQLSSDLIGTLEKLLGSQEHLRAIFKDGALFDESGAPYWKEDNFKEWVTGSRSLSVITVFIPRLWHIFVYFAMFPFTEPIFHDFNTVDQRISEDGFVQACILLALRGIEILGNTKDGWTAKGDVENSWSQKCLRLSTLLFQGLKSPFSDEDKQTHSLSNEDLTSCAEEELMDAIVLTQPVPYMTGLSFETDLRGIARRLVIDNVAPSYDRPSSYAVSRIDFETFLELCLLLRLGDNPWKRGLILHQTTQICGDVESWDFVADKEEILLSRRLAHAFTKYKLGNIDSISRTSFEAICAAHPNLILGFYQLWTAICTSHTSAPTSQNLGSRLSNCVSQFLSLVGPAVFDQSPAIRWNEDLRQLHLDLQNATLVADSTSEAALDESWLVAKLSSDQHFHILLISAEEAHDNAADTESNERLIALFTSPSESEIPFWDCPGCPSYVWRYGYVQLLPSILTSQIGGLSASFQHDVLQFSPHGHPDRQSNGVRVDLKNGTVVVEWEDSAVQHLKFKSLKCYRMPGTATTVRRSSNN